MKRIAKTFVIATFLSAAGTAMAAGAFPTPSRGDSYSQYDVFPNMATYQTEHRENQLQAAASTYPVNVPEEPSMADEGLVPGIAGVAPFVAQPHDGGMGAAD